MSGTYFQAYDSFELEDQIYFNERSQFQGLNSRSKKRRTCCCRPRVCILIWVIIFFLLGTASVLVYLEWRSFQSLDFEMKSGVMKFNNDKGFPLKLNNAVAEFNLTFLVKSNNIIPLSVYDIKLAGYDSDEKEHVVLEGSVPQAKFDEKVNTLTIPSVFSLPLLPTSSFSKSVLKACSPASRDRRITMYFEFDLGLELLRFTGHVQTYAYEMTFVCPEELVQKVAYSPMVRSLLKLKEPLSPSLKANINLEAVQSAAQAVIDTLTEPDAEELRKELKASYALFEGQKIDLNTKNVSAGTLITTHVFQNSHLVKGLGESLKDVWQSSSLRRILWASLHVRKE